MGKIGIFKDAAEFVAQGQEWMPFGKGSGEGGLGGFGHMAMGMGMERQTQPPDRSLDSDDVSTTRRTIPLILLHVS
jgi:hypothetical protein